MNFSRSDEGRERIIIRDFKIEFNLFSVVLKIRRNILETVLQGGVGVDNTSRKPFVNK